MAEYTSEELLKLGKETDKMDFAIMNRLTYDEIKDALKLCHSKHGRDCLACPLYKKRDCVEILTANALSIIECQAADRKKLEMEIAYCGKQMNDKDEDIYYIVKIKEDIVDSGFYNTTAYPRFCGRLVNKNGSNFYFELNGSNALVFIPHSWIEWMAPSKKLWDLRRKKDK